jgi:hypothetical protein
MDITISSNFVFLRKLASDYFGEAFFRGYNLSKLEEIDLSNNTALLKIGGQEIKFDLQQLTLNGITPTDNDNAAELLSAAFIPVSNSNTTTTVVGNDVNGTFTTVDEKMVTVENGLITIIETTTPPEL